MIRYLFSLFFMVNLLIGSLAYGSERKLTDAYIQQLVLLHDTRISEVANSEPVIEFLMRNQEREASLEVVLKKEKQWSTNKDLQQKITSNVIADEFSGLIANPEYSIAELILTNSVGATIAASPLPTDYWQGDEAKFIEPVQLQKTFISTVVWDESSGAYSFFVAKPIYSGGDLLGVLVAGIDVTTEYLLRMPLDELVNLQIKTSQQ